MSDQPQGQPSTYDLTATRIFEAAPEQVWRAWSEPEQVMRWWGPQGFSCPSVDMDFREGGRAIVCMRASQEFGGQDFYNAWSYHKIVPRERIEFTVTFTDENGVAFDPAAAGMMAGIPPQVRHLITIRALGEGRTELSVSEYGYTTEQARDLSRGGLEQCLDKMAASFGA